METRGDELPTEPSPRIEDDDSDDDTDRALEGAIEAYASSHPELSAVELLRAFHVRRYLWPGLTDEEAASDAAVPEARVAAAPRRALVSRIASWIRTRESEDALRRRLAAAARVVVVHGRLDGGALDALRALAPGPARKRARAAAPVGPPAVAAPAGDPVRAVGAAEAARLGARLAREGCVVLDGLVDAAYLSSREPAMRAAWLPRELNFYPGWRSSDFFLNGPSEPRVPINAALTPLGAALAGGVARAASAVAGEDLVVLQGNATLYSNRTNRTLADHRDGSPYSVVVHVSATSPASAGLEIDAGDGFRRVVFGDVGSAALLRGDEHVHRSVPVDRGDRLVLVFFLDRRGGARAAHPATPEVAELLFYPTDGAAAPDFGGRVAGDLGDAIDAADATLVVGVDVLPPALAAARHRRGVSAEFARAPRAGLCDFSYAGPPARSLAFALGVA